MASVFSNKANVHLSMSSLNEHTGTIILKEEIGREITFPSPAFSPPHRPDAFSVETRSGLSIHIFTTKVWLGY